MGVVSGQRTNGRVKWKVYNKYNAGKDRNQAHRYVRIGRMQCNQIVLREKKH